MTKKQHWSAEIHKESKTDHKNKSLKQVTRGIAENTESLICGRTENIQETHLILPLSFALNIHMEYAVVEMHWRGNQSLQSP